MSTLPFSKYSGSGNTFLCIDNRKGGFSTAKVGLYCDREQTDGILLLEEGSSASPKMRIYNRDGSEAEMCGNGVRAFVKFLIECGHQPQAIETASGTLPVSLVGNEVSVTMPAPTQILWDQQIQLDGMSFTYQALTVGVPHVVLFSDRFEWAPQLRKALHANVNFVTDCWGKELKVRTYERGVERETAACGTGSTASALAYARRQGLTSPLIVTPLSGEKLTISFTSDFSKVTMRGPAEKIAEGKIES